MIAIIQYNAGNVLSVYNAIDRLGYDCIITNDHKKIKDADKVIFPGVGEAFSAMKYLRSNKLDKLIQNLEQPVLGICLGMQLMCNSSEEGPTQCLKIFPNDVVRFKNNDLVPHMGWNNFESADTKLLKGVKISDDLYYVHSYYVEVGESTTAICNYQINFSSIIENENFFGTQFHPEKSSLIGEKVLKNFLLL